MEATIAIRPGVASDAAALAELAERTFRDTFASYCTPEDMELLCAEAYGTSIQHAELVDPDITTLLADVDGQLAGYAQLRRSEVPACVTGNEPIELWRFYIAQPWHGRGIAQKLMQRVESEAWSRGGRTLWLGVWEHNERAKAFYNKYGFTDAGSHLFMVGTDVQTDRIMVRSLPTPTAPRYLRVSTAHWNIDLYSEEAERIFRQIDTDGVRVFRAQPGFIRYRLMRADSTTTVAVAEWESEELGRAGAERYRAWMLEVGIMDKIVLETRAGAIVASS